MEIGDKVRIRFDFNSFPERENVFYRGKVGRIISIDTLPFPYGTSIESMCKKLHTTYWNEDELELLQENENEV